MKKIEDRDVYTLNNRLNEYDVKHRIFFTDTCKDYLHRLRYKSMLCLFSVKNFRGFKEELTLDLAASNYSFNNECVRDNFVHKALIYGYNGVGKSNLGLAVMDIIIHLTDKYNIPLLTANYYNAETGSNLVEFTYRFKFDDSIVEYHYGKTTPESLVYEKLFINEKCVVSYNRAEKIPLTIEIPGTQTLMKDINKIPISILKYIKSNAALEPSVEAMALSSFFDFADRMLFFRNLDDRTYAGYEVGSHQMFDEIIERNHFEDFIKFLAAANVPSNIGYKKIGSQYKVDFIFETEQNDKSMIEFLEYCSTGMRSLFVLFYWLQNAIFDGESPSFVFIDEFDAFYDSRLSEFVVKTIKQIKNCQFILTTHDTGVMTNDIMRPDCLFLMYKDKIRSLSASTGKELRLAHNIEKMYRAGAFDE